MKWDRVAIVLALLIGIPSLISQANSIARSGPSSIATDAPAARDATPTPAPRETAEPECAVLDEGSLRSEAAQYTWYINGKVTNVCSHELRYVGIHFVFFDKAGNQVASGLDNITDLAAGGTWAFHKPVYETQDSDRWRIDKVTSW
jgi:hypothetical protein